MPWNQYEISTFCQFKFCTYAPVGAAASRFCTDVTVFYTMEIKDDSLPSKHLNYQTLTDKLKTEADL